MKKSLYRFSIFLILILSISNSHGSDLKIVSSINPIYQIVKYISGGQGDLLVDPNMSSHDYMLRPSDIRKVQDADLVFYVSERMEEYLPRILKNSGNDKIVKLLDFEGLKLINNDYHIWLNPDNAIIVAKIITTNISELDKNNSSLYEDNLKKFIQEVRESNLKIESLLKNIGGKNYIFYHNGYRYFEDYYDLHSSDTISKYHHQKLSIKDLKRVKNIIKSDHVLCLFGQRQEESSLALKIAKDNNIKFSILDITGSRDYGDKNGYVQLIDDFTKEFVDCLNSN